MIPLGESTAVVMPRTLLAWSRTSNTYEPRPLDQCRVSLSEGESCAAMTLCTSGRDLLQHWRKLGILTGRGSSRQLDFRAWKAWRVDKVTVLHGPLAQECWHTIRALCQCLGFALSSQCEHTRCCSAMLMPDNPATSLEPICKTFPAAAGKVEPSVKFARGQPSTQVMRAVEQQRLRADLDRQSSSRLLPEAVQTSCRSDASAIPCAHRAGGGGGQGSGEAGAARGPTVHRTDFQMVEEELGHEAMRLLEDIPCRIYKNYHHQAWFALSGGKMLRGSHSSISMRGSDAAAIRHCYQAVQALHRRQ